MTDRFVGPGQPERFRHYIATGHVEFWRRAIEIQADRILTASESTDQQIDFSLFVIALGQLLDAARMCAQFDAELNKSIEEFEATLPYVKHFRDLIVHLVDYDMGKGRKQSTLGPAVPAQFWQASDTNVVMHMPPYRVDLRIARNAANALANRALDPPGGIRATT